MNKAINYERFLTISDLFSAKQEMARKAMWVQAQAGLTGEFLTDPASSHFYDWMNSVHLFYNMAKFAFKAHDHQVSVFLKTQSTNQ